MYFPYFITYIALGFAISLAVFFWALKNGQFKDQKRARFLPLEDEHEPSWPGRQRGGADLCTFERKRSVNKRLNGKHFLKEIP
ncbi:MAG: cbb3-type cytochrome oxidase assembly protein CcoS [Deltaproteobacteria bacterium]|nr:cbb3-type cytochrome oxidase assembly protein CcoS [Deltaproteobacteria bacterium]